jgi:hypothetical protein
MVHFEH